MAKFLQYFSTKIDRRSAQMAHFMFEKRFIACSDHGKIFSNILPPKLIVEAVKWLILYLRKGSVLVHAICFP